MRRPLLALLAATALAGTLAVSPIGAAGAATASAATPTTPTASGTSARAIAHLPRGTVTHHQPLRHALWVPGAARAFKLTYVTSNTFGQPALSTGEVFVPKGTAPKGGWPVISWAHGTSGLADSCAPSISGPAEKKRDFTYLHNWITQGYAIVASDYAGLGTSGLQAYLDGRTEAHNVVDMVKAGRAFVGRHLPRDERLSNRWVVIGQSQGGGAAIYTARYATQYGGRGLDYLGAVGTGSPAYIENLVTALGPGVLPVPVSELQNTTAYLSNIIAALAYARPALGVGDDLTAAGRKAVHLADTLCIGPLADAVKGDTIGSWFKRPLATLPHWHATIERYMAMPQKGFDKPFFMANGLEDTDVPFATTAAYVAALKADGQPVTFKTYPTDHSGTLIRSQKDSHPFVRRLFAHSH